MSFTRRFAKASIGAKKGYRQRAVLIGIGKVRFAELFQIPSNPSLKNGHQVASTLLRTRQGDVSFSKAMSTQGSRAVKPVG